MRIRPELFLILLSGLDDKEVKLFLTESRNRLILAKEKAQNLPPNRDKALIFISKFKDDARRVLFQWIKDNIIIEDATEDGAFLEYVKSTLQGYAQTKNSELLGELYRQIIFKIAQWGENAPLTHQVVELCEGAMYPDATNNRASETRVEPIYLDSLCQVALGEKIDKGPAPSPQTSLFIKGIEAVRAEDLDTLNDCIKELELSSQYHPLLSDCREKLIHKSQQEQTSKRGLVLLSTNTHANENIDVEPEEAEWLCRCHKADPRTAFLDAFGYVQNHEVIALTEDELLELLPDEGKIIAHANRHSGRIPHAYEIGVWKIEALHTYRSIKFTTRLHSRDVFEVVEIPFSSKEPDNVRHWLEHNSQPLSNKPIFLLSDNVLIKKDKDQYDPKRLTFNEPFNLWYSLPAFKAWGKKLVLGPLPKPEGLYDCGEIDGLIKKVLRHAIEQNKWPAMTTNQIQQFLLFITNDAEKLERWQIERIITSLRKGVALGDDIREVVNEIMKLDAVQGEIAQEKKKILDDYQQSQTRMRAELDKLTQDRQKLQSEVSAAKQEARQITASLSQAIIKNFQSAKEKGIATLAEAALFQALLGQSSPSANGATVLNGAANLINPRRVEKSGGSFEDTLRACGLDKGRARIWQALATLAIKHGFVVTFKGFAASYVAQVFANTCAKQDILLVDTPLGLMQADEFERAIEQQLEWDVAIITNLNRIPLDILASKLEEMTLSRWLGNNSNNKFFISTLSYGEGCFPVTDRYRYLGPIFDLDSSVSAANMPDLYEALAEIKPSHAVPKIWVDKITALINEAVAAAPDDRKQLLHSVQQAFVPSNVISAIA